MVVGVVALLLIVGLLAWLGHRAAGRVADNVVNPYPSAAASQSAGLQRNQALADDVNASIEALPGVTASSTRYVEDVGVAPSIRVQVTVESEAVSNDVVQGALELVWLSKVDPLDVISIRPTVAGASNLGQEETWQLQLGDAIDLEDRFGPRPG